MVFYDVDNNRLLYIRKDNYYDSIDDGFSDKKIDLIMDYYEYTDIDVIDFLFDEDDNEREEEVTLYGCVIPYNDISKLMSILNDQYTINKLHEYINFSKQEMSELCQVLSNNNQE